MGSNFFLQSDDFNSGGLSGKLYLFLCGIPSSHHTLLLLFTFLHKEILVELSVAKLYKTLN